MRCRRRLCTREGIINSSSQCINSNSNRISKKRLNPNQLKENCLKNYSILLFWTLNLDCIPFLCCRTASAAMGISTTALAMFARQWESAHASLRCSTLTMMMMSEFLFLIDNLLVKEINN